MSHETNKDILRRFFSAYGTADARAMRDLLADDFVAHGMPPAYADGRDGLIKMAGDFKAAFSDCRNTVGDLVAEHDRVVARFTTKAVHTGPFVGAPPSGREVTLTGMELYRFAGGKIAELWGEYNMGDLNH